MSTAVGIFAGMCAFSWVLTVCCLLGSEYLADSMLSTGVGVFCGQYAVNWGRSIWRTVCCQLGSEYLADSMLSTGVGVFGGQYAVNWGRSIWRTVCCQLGSEYWTVDTLLFFRCLCAEQRLTTPSSSPPRFKTMHACILRLSNKY